ncbi:MAG: DnaA ATPase domain-containing protein, partial [Alphaproteobacteria bacterium]
MTGNDRDVAIRTEWDLVCKALEAELGEAIFKSWLSPLEIESVSHDGVKLSAPTRFMRDWVQSKYADRIRTLWATQNPAIEKVDFAVRAMRSKQAAEVDAERVAAEAGIAVESISLPAGNRAWTLEEVVAPLDPRFTFDNFVVGKPNELAHAAARRVVEAKEVPFNPLFLYGGVGLGKTHLMHAIAWYIRERDSSRKVVYLSAEKFMYLFIRALRFKNT